tara:strand:+ start:673 stop:1473 length:801 start_codon:yes stop_codon:yes gene_type:complete
MSLKSLIQIFILLLIIVVIGGVYIKYFDNKENIVEVVEIQEQNDKNQIEQLKKKIIDLELKNKELNSKTKSNLFLNEDKKNKLLEENKEVLLRNEETLKNNDNTNTSIEKKENKKNKQENSKIKNIVKDVEYSSVDQKGNRFYLLASSGKSNINNKDILDLNNVRGEIRSEKRETIYIVSDFAQYNSTNLNSKFYENVIINFQDKEITCINFDINMETNKAIAYNNVVITDPKSVMKAGIVEFDLKTKNVNINPESTSLDIKVTTN